MNPLAIDLLGSLLRWLLAAAGGALVARGIWTQEQATTFAVAGSVALLSLAWSLWKTYGKRLKIVTALAMLAGTTERDLEKQIADPTRANADVTTPKDVPPTLDGKP